MELTSDVESGLDDVEDPQSRASHHPKNPPKNQKPTHHITFQVHGNVNINTVSGAVSSTHEERDNRQRRQSSPPATRGSTRRPPAATKRRPTAQCDFSSDTLTDSEGDLSSSSEENVSPNHKLRRSTNPITSSKRPRQPKRYQQDEGYNTGSTVSYKGRLAKQSEKGKGKASTSTSRGDTVRPARLSSSTKSRESRSRLQESEMEKTGSRSDQDDSRESSSDKIDSGEGNDDNDEEDASDDVRLLRNSIGCLC